MRNPVENTLDNKQSRRIITVVIFFSVIFVCYKSYVIFFGNNIRLIHDILSIVVLIAWSINMIIRIYKKQIKKSIISAFILILLTCFSVINVAETRFSIYKKQYEETAQRYFLEVKQSDNAFFSPITNPENSVLGEMHYFKDNSNIALSFRESNTFFDYYCYVRVFSEEEISKIIPDLEYKQELGNGWYYVNLY